MRGKRPIYSIPVFIIALSLVFMACGGGGGGSGAVSMALVSGILLDSENNPIEAATINIFSTTVTTSTDLNGYFEAVVETGDHTFTATKNGNSVLNTTISFSNSGLQMGSVNPDPDSPFYLAGKNWYLDSDSDGYSNGTTTFSQVQNSGYYLSTDIVISGDCDDDDPVLNPATIWHRDADEDGWAVASTLVQCARPPDYNLMSALSGTGDCDDNEPDSWPGNTEVCDGVDNDCEGTVDKDGSGLDLTQICYSGPPGSAGEGICQSGIQICFAGGYPPECDGEITPLTEICDGVDNDCNGEIDNGALITWYIDADGDDYGSASATTLACTQPAGYVGNDSDCADTNIFINPMATEQCNGRDDNCDSSIDEGNPGGGSTCGTPGTCSEGTVMCVSGGHQCVPDTPWTVETCDGLDNDCDGQSDEDFAELGNFCSSGIGECETSGSFICAQDGLDVVCDATPGDPSSEVCDGLDNNCDGAIDDGFPTLGDQCFVGTGECRTEGSNICSIDGQGVTCDAVAGDPGTETCDGLDNNCDGQVDEGTLTVFYIDQDDDGYGSAVASTLACTVPPGYSDNSSDCIDTNEFINPGILEVCNGIDDDCSGGIDGGEQCETSLLGACNQGTLACQNGRVQCIPDFSSAPETCDQVDNDCDGNIDEIGCSPILVVDDDGGINNRNEVDIGSIPDVDHIYRSDLSALGYSYDVYRVYGKLTDGPSFSTLNMYNAVIWFTGMSYNGSTASPASLTVADQSNLAAYLDIGGRLFLSGGDIIYDLNGASSYFDSTVNNAFANSYLGVITVDQDNAFLPTTFGVPSDPVSNGLTLSGVDQDQDVYVDNFATDSTLTSESGTVVATTTGGTLTDLTFNPSMSAFPNTVFSGNHLVYRLTDETLVFGNFSFWATSDSQDTFDINWYHGNEGSPDSFTKLAAGFTFYQYILQQGIPFDSYPDILNSTGFPAGAATLFTDANGDAVATRVQIGATPSAVYLAFPYEGLWPDADRRIVLDNSLQWLLP